MVVSNNIEKWASLQIRVSSANHKDEFSATDVETAVRRIQGSIQRVFDTLCNRLEVQDSLSSGEVENLCKIVGGRDFPHLNYEERTELIKKFKVVLVDFTGIGEYIEC